MGLIYTCIPIIIGVEMSTKEILAIILAIIAALVASALAAWLVSAI
jgi:hypothetical protein